MKRLVATAALAATLAGCGSASEGVTPGQLGVSARDAFIEARSVARSWDADARLRWVEGKSIGVDGVALPESGAWHFHYTAPDETGSLVVRVTPLETGSEEQPFSSPPGYVIGDNAVGSSWVDSRAVLEAVRAAAAEPPTAPVSLTLVPTRPAKWLVRDDDDRRWQVAAENGEVLSS